MSISNRILIADDDPTNRLFLKKGTADLPYDFVFASDGDSALTKILNDKFDLILLDVIMPGMSGFDIMRSYKEEFPDSKTPFIFLTGRTDREAISEGFALGAVDYITKPFSLQEIRLRIATHHDLYKSHYELDKYARNMESLAEERAQQLLHADRLATLGTMAAGIMHEINNPTTFISGNIQVFQTKFLPLICDILRNSTQAENKKVKFILEELPKMCDGILNGVSRITKITTGLKAFSGCREKNWSTVDINDVINNALLFCKSSLSARININVKQVSPAPVVYGDSQQLEQVLINLCINAGHAIENLKEPNITLNSSISNNKAILSVTDNGPGIADDILKKIWEPFFTTKPSGKGTGLGLAICSEIINSHNGTLKYTGTLNKVTEFTITLPVLSS